MIILLTVDFLFVEVKLNLTNCLFKVAKFLFKVQFTDFFFFFVEYDGNLSQIDKLDFRVKIG